MRLDDLFYSVATGSKRLRLLLTPFGLVVFFGTLLLVVAGSLYMDRLLGFPKLLSGAFGMHMGVVLLSLGLIIWAWCVVWFSKARGTPVPFNPPRELITMGLYAWSRNPMFNWGLRLFVRNWFPAPFCVDSLCMDASVHHI